MKVSRIAYKSNGVRKPDVNPVEVTKCYWCARLTANRSGVCRCCLGKGRTTGQPEKKPSDRTGA